MSRWARDELETIEGTQELQLASKRADGPLRPYVTMWVVRVDDDVYVRSAYGPENRWFRHAKGSANGRIRVGGIESDVAFAEPEPGVHAAIDSAYHAKYDQYGPKIVGSVIGPDVEAVTIRLDPTTDAS